MEQLLFLLALRGGLQHDEVGGFEGTQRSGMGPRAEVELELRYRQGAGVGLAVVAGAATFGDANPYRDPILPPIEYERVVHLTAGLRGYIHLHRSFAVGLTVAVNRTSVIYDDTEGTDTTHRNDIVPEPFVAVTLGHSSCWSIDAVATYARWGVPYDPITETTWSVMLGAARPVF